MPFVWWGARRFWWWGGSEGGASKTFGAVNSVDLTSFVALRFLNGMSGCRGDLYSPGENEPSTGGATHFGALRGV